MSLRSLIRAASSLSLLVSVGLLVSSMAASVLAAVDPLDWPNWRGPQQNRVSTEKGLIDHWDPAGGEGSNLVWKNKDLGGRSTPVVFRGKLYTIVIDKPKTKDEGEKVVCVDAATGKQIWEHRFNVYFTEVPADRVGWSNCCVDPETGRVYAQGVCGYFCCLEGDTGKLVWDHSLHEELGLISGFGGRTNTPIIFEDNLLISSVVVGWGDAPKWGLFALPAHRFMCFNKANGELRWMNGSGISPYDTTYSTPTVMPLAGQQTLVFNSGDGGVWALQPRTGTRLWNFPFGRWGMNASPLVTNDGRVYTSHAVENTFGNAMGSVLALDGTMKGDLSNKEVWRDVGVMAGLSSPVMLNDRLYVVDDGAALYVYDAKSGKKITRKKLARSIHSVPLVADGKIYLCTINGLWYVLKPTEDGVEVVEKVTVPTEGVDGSPILSHGRFYLPTTEALYCFGSKEGTSSADPLPPAPKEKQGAETGGPLQVQVVPYDVVLSPGKQQKFQVRFFDALGREVMYKLKPGALQFSVDGPGTITSDGTYQAPTDKEHQCALVTCKFGDRVGSARIRIVPPLPWKFDFNKSQAVPLTWLGGRVRWELRDNAGDKYIAKKTVLPTPKDPKNKLGTRSYLWMGPVNLANYTIQADVLLKQIDGRISDVGLIDSGYQLWIRAKGRTLRLDSWAASDYRSKAEMEFQPKADTWYTMKLSVVPGDGESTVSGKVWERGQQEPESWTVQMVDKTPNTHGTPGIFGNSPDAEIYLDNLTVTPNQ